MTTATATRTTRLAAYIAEGLVASVGTYADNAGGYAKFRMFFAEDQRAEAEAWSAQFPKSNKVRVTTCSGNDSNFYSGESLATSRIIYVDKVTGEEMSDTDPNRHRASAWSAPYVTVDFNFVANGVTGEKNEAAAKRLRSFLKNLDKLGIAYTEGDKMGGAITMAELLERFA